MAIAPLIFLLVVLVGVAVLLRLRKVATGRSLSDRAVPVDDDTWAEDAMFQHYMAHGTTDPYAR